MNNVEHRSNEPSPEGADAPFDSDNADKQFPGGFDEVPLDAEGSGQHEPSGTNNRTDATDALQDLLNAAKAAEEKGESDTQAWAVVLEAMMKFDERQVSGWRNDLQNMLIFAGLFSAVATAFVIESYSWLQQDSSDTSAYLLMQISQQLSSFTFSNGFINSTAPVATPPTFTPESVYVRINILWFLSLAMSLIASLMAIIIQQWMQAYQSFTYTSIREAVRLYELRYWALRGWRVGWIVSSVPILLQIALVLFLTGGWLFLQSLNNTVFTPYAAFVAVALFLFANSVFWSAAVRSCPYKSPLSFTLAVITKLLISVVWYCLYPIFDMIFVPIFACIIGYRYMSSRGTDETRLDLAIKYRETLHRGETFFGGVPVAYASTGPTEYWLACERSLLPKRKDLDGGALSSVFPWLSREDFPYLLRCLKELASSEEQLRVVVGWAARSLGVSPYVMRMVVDLEHIYRLDSEVLSRIDEDFIAQYSHILANVLPSTWKVEVLRKSQPRTKPRKWYQVKTWPIVRLPTVALFRCSTALKYTFTCEELLTLLTFATDELSEHTPFNPGSAEIDWTNGVDLILASSATALDALTRLTETTVDEAVMSKSRQMLAGLGELVQAEHRRIRLMALHSEDWGAREPAIPYVTVPALISLSHSIVSLARAGHVWQEASCPSRSVATALRDLVFEGLAILEEGVEILDQLKDIPSPKPQEVEISVSMRGLQHPNNDGCEETQPGASPDSISSSAHSAA
ncbi:hypothetical protein NM688_g1467 [Phlebia brevispora]|uniref:Uncharacterized protein n=1 Tax=Phlebia brevispora TaxID=194682 RepID=A0ACC1TB77_9APHY|nr:hypothetical protein NM688_g1467 [Phlebia brevispora]